eukprot:TRINITY_DN641_c0_g3_i1.p2 TRINITY_DN641_c0_g3~~TRINITY_DN641_c0_g3_i1.p2  ORF type:complete len:118 (+),score=13.98 TRINITY_DN641_c0_g3_i1:552-905(+)
MVTNSAGSFQTAAMKRHRFCLGMDCGRALRYLHDTLIELKGNPKRREGSLEIKGFCNSTRGLLTYIICASPLSTAEWTFMEMRRGRGDTLDFHRFYRSVVEKLGSTVVSKETMPVQG